MAKFHGSSKRRHQTPRKLDYLFEREIIDEESYSDFWERYWKRNETGREDLIKEYTELAAETGTPVSGVVTKSKADTAKQAQALNDLGDTVYRVVRRNAKGQFSRRGKFYQAIKL